MNDAKDAARYRYLAADGDRAVAILTTYTGLEVEVEIDKGIAAQSRPHPVATCGCPLGFVHRNSCHNWVRPQ